MAVDEDDPVKNKHKNKKIDGIVLSRLKIKKNERTKKKKKKQDKIYVLIQKTINYKYEKYIYFI